MSKQEEDTTFGFENFEKRFKTASVPYQLTDTGFLRNTDTTRLTDATFAGFIPDSVKKKISNKPATIKYIPLSKIKLPNGEDYFIVKAVSGTRKIALLIAFNKDSFGAAMPFLIPDEDPRTTQTSSIDKSFSIIRSVSHKTTDDVITEGKDVYVYNQDAKSFTLIMTDVLDEKAVELINPIDTLRRTSKWAGDYITNKQNMVSVRDGKTANEINFFVHFEKDDGDCKGELKGTAFFASSKIAVYREGGDPCVMELHFSPTSVTVKEMEGCGAHRDLKCSFNGTFIKKQPPKKPATKKTKKK
ncbi:MAG: hypothetical protein ABR503_03005 [Chitinophagaceae bacterium]